MQDMSDFSAPVARSASEPGALGAGRSAGAGRAESPALGNNVKSGGRLGEKAPRYLANIERWKAKDHASNLLMLWETSSSDRVWHCGRVRYQPTAELGIRPKHQRAGYRGFKTCGSVWWCPCCSQRISLTRKDELNRLMAGARQQGLAVVLLTLTARHDVTMPLAPFLDAMKEAKGAKFCKRRDYKALPLVGSVTATEVTHGRNGWHPHFHVLLVLDCAPDIALAKVRALASGWLAALKACGLDGGNAAFDAKDGSAAGAYVAKWGAAEEMTLTTEKAGRSGGRSPWQLLADAREGDKRAGAIWLEYAKSFKGKAQLFWSRGLKARFGIGEVSDDEASAEVPEGETAPDFIVLREWLGGTDALRQAMRRRFMLIDAAEKGLPLDAAEFGPTDEEVFRRSGPSGPVVEPD